jgi:hypothetical protein
MRDAVFIVSPAASSAINHQLLAFHSIALTKD